MSLRMGDAFNLLYVWIKILLFFFLNENQRSLRPLLADPRQLVATSYAEKRAKASGIPEGQSAHSSRRANLASLGERTLLVLSSFFSARRLAVTEGSHTSHTLAGPPSHPRTILGSTYGLSSSRIRSRREV